MVRLYSKWLTGVAVVLAARHELNERWWWRLCQSYYEFEKEYVMTNPWASVLGYAIHRGNLIAISSHTQFHLLLRWNCFVACALLSQIRHIVYCSETYVAIPSSRIKLCLLPGRFHVLYLLLHFIAS